MNKKNKKSDKKYWRQRSIKYEKEWNRRCKETIENRLSKHYQKALVAIKEDIQQLYAIFAKDNGMDFGEARRFISSKEFRDWRMTMQEYLQLIANGDKGLELELNTLAMRPRINRLEKLYGETLQELDNLGREVGKSMRDFLADAYKGNYYRNIFDFVKVGGMSVALSKLDNLSVEKVLSARWSGKNYSQRIWNNTRLLSGVIKDTIANGVHRGLSIPQMSRMIEDKMHAGYSNAVRLVRTEMNFVNNQAHYDSMSDAGVEYYEFIAVLDNRTTTRCRARDGEVYLLEERDVGVNYPPLHARCRSTVAPFIEGVSRKGTRVARDKSGKNIDIPAAMKYKDYEAVYIKKEKSLETWKEEHRRIATGQVNPGFSAKTFIPEPKTLDESRKLAEKYDVLIDKYVSRPSKWSGAVVISDKGYTCKKWGCDIAVHLEDCPNIAILHELLHARSLSYYPKEVYYANRAIEEATAQFLAEEICKREGIPVVISKSYEHWVNILREFNRKTNIYHSELEFAQDLIEQPLYERIDWLIEKARTFIIDKSGGTLSDLIDLTSRLYEIEWLD